MELLAKYQQPPCEFVMCTTKFSVLSLSYLYRLLSSTDFILVSPPSVRPSVVRSGDPRCLRRRHRIRADEEEGRNTALLRLLELGAGFARGGERWVIPVSPFFVCHMPLAYA